MYYFLLRDMIEIVIYASIIYCFCLWLKTDTTKNLLLYFLGYCGLVVCTWVMQLSTLFPFLLMYTPIILLLFIIFHQKTLQRNFVALCAITPSHINQNDWLDNILSSCLIAINDNKNVSFIIEHKNSIEHFLIIPFFINALISKELLTILFSSTHYDEQKMIFITSNGTITSFNVTWNISQETELLLPRQQALFYTLHTDAIVLCTDHLNRTFSIVIDGKETTALSAQHVRMIIKKQLTSTIKQHKGTYRENKQTEKTLF